MHGEENDSIGLGTGLCWKGWEEARKSLGLPFEFYSAGDNLRTVALLDHLFQKVEL